MQAPVDYATQFPTGTNLYSGKFTGYGKTRFCGKIIGTLGCSEPTLSRALKELRESYAADIKYSKAGHSYQLVSFGQLDKKHYAG